MAKNPRIIDMTGRQIGRWTVLKQAGNAPGGAALWMCLCACGTQKAVGGQDLRSGRTQSCGCASREDRPTWSTTHGESRTRLYRIWKAMRTRCHNPNIPGYHLYGGRGITICSEWSRYEAFRDWAIAAGYRDDLSIERLDNDNGYCPENCTWATKQEQSENRRFVQRAPDGELWWRKAQANGITQGAYRTRLYDGWSHEEASSVPVFTPSDRPKGRKRHRN